MTVTPDDVAAAFALEPPFGPLEVIQERGPVMAWRLRAGSGPVLIKRFWDGPELPWQAQLQLAMEVEQLAVDSGINSPRPIEPAHPQFGTVARIDDHGLFRAFPYIEHRALGEEDEVADWLGSTLAVTHRLRRLTSAPHPNWWYGQFPPVAAGQWGRWLATGEARGSDWAPALRKHHDLILELAEQVFDTFVTSPPHVVSHRDVEPWNVLIPLSPSAPMLIDWDTTGPESAPLEAAYAFTVFARRGHDDPDPEQVRRAHSAYVAAGGEPLVDCPRPLDRLVGVELAKVAGGIRKTLDGPEIDDSTTDRLERLPAAVANIRRWERIFRRGPAY